MNLERKQETCALASHKYIFPDFKILSRFGTENA